MKPNTNHRIRKRAQKSRPPDGNLKKTNCKRSSGRLGDQIPLTLQDKDCFINRYIPMRGRRNRNNRFLVTAALFQIQITSTNFRIAFLSDCTLYKQRFDICTGTADSCRFLLSGIFMILRCKTSPRA